MPDQKRLQKKQQLYHETKEALAVELEAITQLLRSKDNLTPIAQIERSTVKTKLTNIMNLFNAMDNASYNLFEELEGVSDRLAAINEEHFGPKLD